MNAPDDPLAAPSGTFAEPWQASVLAMAAVMIREGLFTQNDWADTLGQNLRRAEQDGKPDTDATFFEAALNALEALSEASGISAGERLDRKTAWEAAYRRTPHGKPVTL